MPVKLRRLLWILLIRLVWTLLLSLSAIKKKNLRIIKNHLFWGWVVKITTAESFWQCLHSLRRIPMWPTRCYHPHHPLALGILNNFQNSSYQGWVRHVNLKERVFLSDQDWMSRFSLNTVLRIYFQALTSKHCCIKTCMQRV